jgi:hypothetical protein
VAKRTILYDTTDMPYQEAFQESTKPKVYLSAGFGAGKTYSLIMKGFELMSVNAGLAGGIVAPTTKMYKRDVVPTIKDICRENHIRYSYNKSDMQWFFPDSASTIYVFHGEDDGDSIKGPNLAWMLMNEVTLLSKRAFLMALARVRLKKAKRLQVAMSGTPESFNWAYEYFIENPRADTDLIFGDSRLNKHVASGYIDMLVDSYDTLMQQQYVEGRFVNMSGNRAAWAFNRHKHTSKDVHKVEGMPVWVSVDFNVSPMAATLWNRIPLKMDFRTGQAIEHGLRAFDEICLESSNTYELVDALKQKVNPETEQVILYPDPAGAARSTKTRNVSDFDILKEGGFTNIKARSIISVKDCLNATNAMFSKEEILINSEKCRQLIADCEQCVLKEGIFEIDKSNPKRTHWLDGMKNMIQYEFPIKRSSPAFREERYL